MTSERRAARRGDPAAAHGPAQAAAQPGCRGSFFGVGDGGQVRPEVDGLLPAGGMRTHDVLRFRGFTG